MLSFTRRDLLKAAGGSLAAYCLSGAVPCVAGMDWERLKAEEKAEANSKTTPLTIPDTPSPLPQSFRKLIDAMPEKMLAIMRSSGLQDGKEDPARSLLLRRKLWTEIHKANKESGHSNSEMAKLEAGGFSDENYYLMLAVALPQVLAPYHYSVVQIPVAGQKDDKLFHDKIIDIRRITHISRRPQTSGQDGGVVTVVTLAPSKSSLVADSRHATQRGGVIGILSDKNLQVEADDINRWSSTLLISIREKALAAQVKTPLDQYKFFASNGMSPQEAAKATFEFSLINHIAKHPVSAADVQEFNFNHEDGHRRYDSFVDSAELLRDMPTNSVNAYLTWKNAQLVYAEEAAVNQEMVSDQSQLISLYYAYRVYQKVEMGDPTTKFEYEARLNVLNSFITLASLVAEGDRGFIDSLADLASGIKDDQTSLGMLYIACNIENTTMFKNFIGIEHDASAGHQSHNGNAVSIPPLAYVGLAAAGVAGGYAAWRHRKSRQESSNSPSS